MGEIADGIINGDFDCVTGEYLGEGQGFPRTLENNCDHYKKKKKTNWKKVTDFLNSVEIKAHLHPEIVKKYGCKYTGKSPLKNACFEILQDFERFKTYVKTNFEELTQK